jgi:putative ABC transport system permease protein
MKKGQDDEIEREIRTHLDLEAEERVADGMSVTDAQYAACRAFGNVTRTQEDVRAVWTRRWLDVIVQDVGYALRTLRKSPGFTTVAVLTLALGIGATTAMFSVVYGVLLQPLPYGEPNRLVNIWSTAPSRGLPRAFVAMANLYDWRARNRVFEDIGVARAIANVNLIGQGTEPERLLASPISATLLPLLRASPMLGRGFTDDEDEIGHERVAILSYGLWHRRFGGDPSVVGTSISLSGVPHTVVGVMGRDFAFPSRDYQIWTPLTFDPNELINRQNYSYLAVARLRSGVTVREAAAELDVISAQIAREHPKENTGIGSLVVPMHEDAVATVRRPLYVLLGAVIAMLLIGCANLANLLLARGLIRQRELAVRAALGAGRARLVVQSIAELVPMLLLGGALGLAAAVWAVGAVGPLLPADLPRAENISIQMPVLGFAAATLAAIAVFAGAWPALETSRGALATMTADLSRAVTGGPQRARMRDALVIGQVAATLWLAIAALLLVRSFSELKRVDPGFNPERVYSAHLAVPRSTYTTDAEIAALYQRLLERVQSLPHIVSAGIVNRLPLGGVAQTAPIEFDGIDSPLAPPGHGLQSDIRPVTPDYFRTLQIPLLAGRGLRESDDAKTTPVGIVDERIANAIFGGPERAIGRRFRPPLPGQEWRTIVGVVGHIRHDRLDDDGRPQVYFSYKQLTQDRAALVVRADSDLAAVGRSIAATIGTVDPGLPMYDARPLEAVIDRSVAQRWLQTAILASFATIALVLASIGVYGVIAYAVGQRQREYGIRLALGATRREIVTQVTRRGAALFTLGALGGLIAATATARLLSTMLFRVSSFDLASFAGATLVLLVVALAATGLPARRAASVDPAVTLRAD